MENCLFSPLQVGDIEIPNRIVMAPLTRQRSGKSRVPNPMMAEYYAQRSGAGLIISEATSIESMGVGYEDTPGIWSKEQIAGWKLITEAVHQRGGRIFLQLWHVGRVSHPYFLNGELPVAPSAIRPCGYVSLIRPKLEFVVPRELGTQEVADLVQRYKEGAENAKMAGFDGVEIHAANGYLIDQFIQSTTNKRTDIYGGSIENRSRFLLEIVDAVTPVWGAGRLGVHLAPASDAHDMGDESPKETFGYIARELGKRKIAFIFTREVQREEYLTPFLKQEFGGVVIANQELSLATARDLIRENKADAVAWGKYFISNPDLVEKIRKGIEWAPFNPDTFYTKGPEGYIDYPLMTSNPEARPEEAILK
jgi:2,4-dienoyl-CoA reductase-like NADH-dependent reductase (Old Yellow Enzyme family)